MADNELLSIPDAAKLWGCSERTAYRRVLKLTEADGRVTEGDRVFVRRFAVVRTMARAAVTEPLTELDGNSLDASPPVDGSLTEASAPPDGTFRQPGEALRAALADAEQRAAVAEARLEERAASIARLESDATHWRHAFEEEQRSVQALTERLAEADARAALLMRAGGRMIDASQGDSTQASGERHSGTETSPESPRGGLAEWWRRTFGGGATR